MSKNSTGRVIVKNPKLTRKQTAFVQKLIDNPKMSATEAVRQTYNVTTNRSAEVTASENLRKPEIVSTLNRYSNTIEDIISSKAIELSSSDKLEEVKEGLLNSRWIHDKIHGKATQKVETQNTSVNISIDLSSGDFN